MFFFLPKYLNCLEGYYRPVRSLTLHGSGFSLKPVAVNIVEGGRQQTDEQQQPRRPPQATARPADRPLCRHRTVIGWRLGRLDRRPEVRGRRSFTSVKVGFIRLGVDVPLHPGWRQTPQRHTSSLSSSLKKQRFIEWNWKFHSHVSVSLVSDLKQWKQDCQWVMTSHNTEVRGQVWLTGL